MTRFYLSLASLIILFLSYSCNKPNDITVFSRMNLQGSYSVVYEAIERAGAHGVMNIVEDCGAKDTVVVSYDFFTWYNQTEKCPAVIYNEGMPYLVGFSQMRINNYLYEVEHWDGYTLRISSNDFYGKTNDQERHVLEITRLKK